MKIKTIDVYAREWFDKIYGNSYFSAIVTVNYGMKTEKRFKLPFQYGSGDHFLDMAKEKLQEEGYLPKGNLYPLSRYCRENNIIFRQMKQEKCTKKETQCLVEK